MMISCVCQTKMNSITLTPDATRLMLLNRVFRVERDQAGQLLEIDADLRHATLRPSYGTSSSLSLDVKVFLFGTNYRTWCWRNNVWMLWTVRARHFVLVELQ